MLKKILVFVFVLVLSCFLLIPAFAASSSDITQTGNVLGSGVGLPAGHSRNIAFPYFATSPSITFSGRVSGSNYYFTLDNANYSLALTRDSAGDPVVPFCVFRISNAFIILCRGASFIPVFRQATQNLYCTCWGFYRIEFNENGLLLDTLTFSELANNRAASLISGFVTPEEFNDIVLYCDTNYPILQSDNLTVYAKSGVSSSAVLYSLPCLTRYGYWLNGVHVNIFSPNGNQPIPVLMTRGPGDMYYIITCRYADYQDFRLNVERIESNNRYSYDISVDFKYSVFGVSASDPANWERLSTNDPAGTIVTVSNRNDLVASTYPVSFADNIDNVFFWQNPKALTTYSNSPVYIPPLGDSVSSFDELEGDFLQNADDILNGFVIEFFDGLANDLSYLYSAFESWRFLVGGIIVDKFYVVVSCSLACGVIMLMVGLFGSVLKGGKKE